MNPQHRRAREARRDKMIASFSFAEVIKRLELLAPEDVAALDTIARSVLRRRWPGTQPLSHFLRPRDERTAH